MTALYLADVLANMRSLSVALLLAAAAYTFLAVVAYDAHKKNAHLARVPSVGFYVASAVVVLSLVTLVFTPTVETMRQMGGLVPMRKHEGKYGEHCKHIIWRPAEVAEDHKEKP